MNAKKMREWEKKKKMGKRERERVRDRRQGNGQMGVIVRPLNVVVQITFQQNLYDTSTGIRETGKDKRRVECSVVPTHPLLLQASSARPGCRTNR